MLTLLDLEKNFKLQFNEDSDFFSEWQSDLPVVNEFDQHSLDRVKAGYLNLIRYPAMIEDSVKLSVLSPILHAAEFFLNPLHVESEYPVQLSDSDDEISIEGKIDALVLKDQLWLMVIESKRPSYSIEAGLPQILSYMLANPSAEKPCFGMITTGGSFIFVKLVKEKPPQYSTSRIFEMRNPGNELYTVLSILKYLEKSILEQD